MIVSICNERVCSYTSCDIGGAQKPYWADFRRLILYDLFVCFVFLFCSSLLLTSCSFGILVGQPLAHRQPERENWCLIRVYQATRFVIILLFPCFFLFRWILSVFIRFKEFLIFFWVKFGKQKTLKQSLLARCCAHWSSKWIKRFRETLTILTYTWQITEIVYVDFFINFRYFNKLTVDSSFDCPNGVRITRKLAHRHFRHFQTVTQYPQRRSRPAATSDVQLRSILVRKIRHLS